MSGMESHLRMAASFVVLVLATSPVSAADEAEPRLKYRSKGPVCSCSSGLGEAEISRAMTGLDRLRAAEPGNRDGATTGTEQQQTRRETDEERK